MMWRKRKNIANYIFFSYFMACGNAPVKRGVKLIKSVISRIIKPCKDNSCRIKPFANPSHCCITGARHNISTPPLLVCSQGSHLFCAR